MFGKLIVAVVVLAPLLSKAQGGPDSATYRRAQMLVNDGNAIAGRAIVDSMIARATPGTNGYAEGLYWRAVLSATASDAEMDYRRIVVDYPLSPRVEDVLLRLAQLELARADYDGALQHLNRLTLEHPAGATRARAGYWTARVLFEKNDIQRACAVNADALSRTGESDAELRNQISYLNQRCVGVVAAATPAPTSIPAPGPAGSAANDSASRVNPNASSAKPASIPVPVPVPTPVSTPVSGAAAAQSPTAAKKPPMRISDSPRDAKPSMIEPTAKAGAPTTSGTTSKTTSADAAAGSTVYTVQTAAYNVKSQADAMVAKLRKRGYEARVFGTRAPFRVRIGRYPTQSQANAVMRSLKAKQIDGFVVKAESR